MIARRPSHWARPWQGTLPMRRRRASALPRWGSRDTPAERRAREKVKDETAAVLEKRIPAGHHEGRRAQGVAAARPPERDGRPLHGGAADARDGPAGRGSRQGGQDDGQRPRDAMPGRPGEPPVPGARPNALWLSNFTYVATWQGFV